MCTPMPMRSEGWLGDPKPHHVPPPGTVAQRISERLRMYQPSSAGTRPTSVSSTFASSRMARRLAGRSVGSGLGLRALRADHVGRELALEHVPVDAAVAGPVARRL